MEQHADKKNPIKRVEISLACNLNRENNVIKIDLLFLIQGTSAHRVNIDLYSSLISAGWVGYLVPVSDI